MSATTQRPELIKLECPNCGSPISQFDPGAKTLICPACNSYVEVGSGIPQTLGESGRLQKLNVPIKPGDNATINGTEYFVLGRVDYLGWSPGDRSETWRWTEWLLGEKKGRLLWLSYDEKGFTLYQKVRNTPPFDVHSSRRLPVGDGREALVHERYPAKIVGAEGELTWRPKIDAAMTVVDAAGFGKRYSVQQSGEEVEIYEGDPVDELALAQQFNDQKWIKRVNQRKENSQTWMWIGALCFIFAVVGLTASVIAGRMGDRVQTFNVDLSATNPTVTVPITLERAAGRPADITTRYNGVLPANTSFDVDVYATGPNETRTFLFSQFFWYETGVDEDGRWTDIQYESSNQFVPMENGSHTLELSLAEPFAVNEVNLDVTVTRNRFITAWFVFYSICVGVLGIMAFVMAAGVSKVASTLAAMSD